MTYTVFTKEFARKSSEISIASLRTAIALMSYISESTGFLVDNNGRLLTSKEVQQITGYASCTVKKSMTELAEYKIFTREERGRTYVYRANSRYLYGGTEE